MDRLGDYRLRRRLAVGGMGEVYLGEKIGPEGFVKPVVLKCVLPQLAKDQAFVQLFLDEARLAALLNHPNIAQVYDFGFADNIYYMAMEYVPGYTVDDIRRKHRSINKFMPIEHIALIATQATQGLHYAHSLTDASNVSLGLVHRDVSPHNLIVSVDGTVKIVDFGIAKARSGLTRVQAKGAVGKFGYMSPEQSRGEQVDPRTDVFSLGICLWELATNNRLHDAKLDRAPDYRRSIPPVSSFRPDVPKQFDAVLETALSLGADQRFESAQEMHLGCERFLAAMTHYAGASALAGYIKDLVEGRVENPEVVTTGGGMVQPMGGSTPARTDKAGGGMEAAQKYEEVFGINLEGSSGPEAKPAIKAVPKSWETAPKKPAAPPAPAPVATAPLSFGGEQTAPTISQQAPDTGGLQVHSRQQSRQANQDMELSEPTSELELDTEHKFIEHGVQGGFSSPPPSRPKPPPQRAGAVPKPKKTATRPTGSSKAPMVIAVLVILLALGGGAAVLFTDQVSEIVEGLLGSKKSQDSSKTLTGDYRIVTTPPGAEVIVDGKNEGQAPVPLSLIPGVEYQMELRLAEHATRRLVFKAETHPGVQDRSFKLGPAGRLRIQTTPPGASVKIDGFELTGRKTPFTLEDVPVERMIRLEMTLQGKPKMVRQIKVSKNKREVLKAEFPER